MSYVSTTVSCTADEFSMRRIRQIMHRDTRVIKRYLNIIHQNETYLLQRKDREGKYKECNRINASLLDHITLTTSERTTVRHDLKAHFMRISHNEMVECRDTAMAMYHSYLELKQKEPKASSPRVTNLIPRSIGYRRFKLEENNLTIKVIDSMDTNLKMIREQLPKIRHNYLTLNFKPHPHYFKTKQMGQLVSIKLLWKNHKLFLTLSYKLAIEQKQMKPLQPTRIAILGIDLGINIAATTALLTKSGVVERKTFKVNNHLKRRYLNVLDKVGYLQRQVTMLDRHFGGILYEKLNHLNLRTNLVTYFRERDWAAITSEVAYLLNEINTQRNTIHAQLQSLSTQYKTNITIIKQLRRQRSHLTGLAKTLYHIEDVKGKYDLDVLYKQLKQLRHRRQNLAIEIDRLLVHQIGEYIATLNHKYDL